MIGVPTKRLVPDWLCCTRHSKILREVDPSKAITWHSLVRIADGPIGDNILYQSELASSTGNSPRMVCEADCFSACLMKAQISVESKPDQMYHNTIRCRVTSLLATSRQDNGMTSFVAPTRNVRPVLPAKVTHIRLILTLQSSSLPASSPTDQLRTNSIASRNSASQAALSTRPMPCR